MTQRRAHSQQAVWHTPNFWSAEYHVAHQPIQEGATLLARKTGAWGQKLQQVGQWERRSSKLAPLRKILSVQSSLFPWSLGSRKNKVLYSRTWLGFPRETRAWPGTPWAHRPAIVSFFHSVVPSGVGNEQCSLLMLPPKGLCGNVRGISGCHNGLIGGTANI